MDSRGQAGHDLSYFLQSAWMGGGTGSATATPTRTAEGDDGGRGVEPGRTICGRGVHQGGPPVIL